MEPEDASQPLAESKEDEEELLACSHCSNPITWREDILQERVNTFKEAVYPYELAVCDKESWCYLATDPQNNRFDLIRTRATAAVRLVASPCEDYSWFPGYAWRAAYCDSCQAQIGWGFCAPFVCGGCETGASSPSSKLWNMAPQFLGVILTRLRPSSQAKAQARFRQFRELPEGARRPFQT
ncbi:unnamed protein product [Effrenium voratum]|nr:unnamed protein product [Effrenium voratum]